MVSGKCFILLVKLSVLADNITVLQNKRPDTKMNKWGVECRESLLFFWNQNTNSLKPVNIKTNITMLFFMDSVVFERCMFGSLKYKLLFLVNLSILQIVTVNFMYQLDGAKESPAICSNINIYRRQISISLYISAFECVLFLEMRLTFNVANQ